MRPPSRNLPWDAPQGPAGLTPPPSRERPLPRPSARFPPELRPRHMFLFYSHKVRSGKNLQSRL